MNDWMGFVQKEYPIEVKAIRKVRGAVLCEAKDGPYLLQPYQGSERHLEAEYRLLEQLSAQGLELIDRIVCTTQGALSAVNEYQERYVLKQWFEGEECGSFDMKRLCIGMRRLGELHIHMKSMKGMSDGEQMPYEWKNYAENSLLADMEKHNRELRKIRTYIRERRKKTQFETCVLESFSSAYDQAQRATLCMQRSEYASLFAKALESISLCHGDYNYHNLIFLEDSCAIVHFAKFGVQVQLKDLYDYLRKIMEKYNWDIAVGAQLLEEYNRKVSLSDQEVYVLACMLLYPEKYWKQLNFFYNGNKTWISAKSIEKLTRAVTQCPDREEFIERALGVRL